MGLGVPDVDGEQHGARSFHAMTLRLYVVPASHPCAAVEAALQLKGFDYKVTELPPGVHAVHQRLRFGKRTVPSLKADGQKLSGSTEIMRWLERAAPDARAVALRRRRRGRRSRRRSVGRRGPAAARAAGDLVRRCASAPTRCRRTSRSRSCRSRAGWRGCRGPGTALVEWRLQRRLGGGRPGRRRRPSRRTCSASRAGSTRGCWAARRRTPPTSRSPRRLGAPAHDRRPHAARSTPRPPPRSSRRFFPGYPGSIPPGTLS